MNSAQDEPRYMTREEAVVWLMAWAEHYIPKYNLDFSPAMKQRITSGVSYVWLHGLINELIDRVRNGTEDPITEVAMFYYEMDEVLALSDDNHLVTHRFAGFMEEWAHCILSYMKKKEKEMWDYERQRILRQSLGRSETSHPRPADGQRNRPDADRNCRGG